MMTTKRLSSIFIKSPMSVLRMIKYYVSFTTDARHNNKTLDIIIRDYVREICWN